MIRTKWLWLYAGRDHARMMPLNIFIGLFPRGKPEPYRQSFWFEADMSFDWRFRFCRQIYGQRRWYGGAPNPPK